MRTRLGPAAFPAIGFVLLSLPPLIPAQASGPAWLPLVPASRPSVRSAPAMTYDAGRARVVLFGGDELSTLLADTWERDGTTWIQAAPIQSPSARKGAAIAYDAGRARTVLFSGANSPSDTWEWDGAQWTLAAVGGPPAGAFTMAYDAARGRLVLFTGTQTWEWIGASWSLRALAHAPAVGDPGRMVFDATRARVVWFGGAPAGETWEYDGSDWTERAPATTPPGRTQHAMIFDTERAVVVLFGGRSGPSPAGDTWEWNGSDWTQVAATVSQRWDVGFAYDQEQRRAVLFGGINCDWICVPYDDTWEYRVLQGVRTRWTQGASLPFGVVRPGTAYDTDRSTIVVFGGEVGGKGLTPTDLMFEGNATGWQSLHPGTLPPGRSLHGIAYDAARRNTVIFGGLDPDFVLSGDTWVWNGTSWAQRFPAVSPTPRAGQAMAYDAARQRVLMFGGTDPPETWEWDGAWLQRTPASSPPFTAVQGIVYDAARRRIVWVGQVGTEVLTHEWDGSTWTERSPVHRPPLLQSVALAYHAARQRVLLFGRSGTWEWDGDDWTQLLTLTSPSPLESAAGMTYDAARRTAVALGGQTFTVPGESNRVWELDTIQSADYARFGSGCAGTAGVLSLAPVAGSLPWIGDDFTLELYPLPASPVTPAIFVGASSASWAGLTLPFGLGVIGAPGCSLYTGIEIAIPIARAGAAATWTLPLPNDPVFAGLSFFVQGLVLGDPSNPAQLGSSDAGRLTIGVR